MSIKAQMIRNETRVDALAKQLDARRAAHGTSQNLAEVAAPGSWSEPQNLTDPLPPVPPFPVMLLPATLRPWVSDVSERMQCPPDFVAAPALVALGALVGRRVGIRPKQHDDWIEIPNLWGAVIGRPGMLKSPAISEALRPLRRLEAEAAEAFDQEMQEHRIGGFVSEAHAEILKSKMHKAAKGGRQAEAEALAHEMAEQEAKPAPTCRRFIMNDATIEKTGMLLAENPNGLLYVRDELTGLFASMGREGHEADRAFLLECWNGQNAYTVDRIGRGTLRIPSTTLALFGGIQPGPLAEYVIGALRGAGGADGFLQRFQVLVWPDDTGQWQNVDRWPDNEAKNTAFSTFSRLAELDPVIVNAQTDTDGGIPWLRFSPEAQVVFDIWRAELEGKLRSDLPEALESHLAKYRKLMPALALLLHLADGGVDPVAEAIAIRAAGLCEFFEAHARRLYAIAGKPERFAARELAKHLRKGDLPNPFTARDVYRQGWRHLADPEITQRACRELEDCGWLQAVTSDTGGRPSARYFVNPKITGVKP